MAITTLKLTKEHFQEILRKGFSLDHIFILTLIKEGHDVSFLLEDSMKIEALHQGLVRRGLINEENKLTLLGHELLDFLSTKMTPKTRIVRMKTENADFDQWWEAFPATDNFEYKGRVFVGTRSMRAKKEQCLLKFNQIINDNQFTAKQIIDATKYIVTLRKEASIKKKSNELTYMHNSYTFLEQGDFKPFINLSDKSIKTIEEENNSNNSGVTDI